MTCKHLSSKRTAIGCALAVWFFAPASAQQLPKDLGPLEYYRPPQLSAMVQFTKDPEHKGHTMEEWRRNLGRDFDARALVERCRRAGAVQIIWIDKWIDGLVFHDTKTTTYKAERDFLGEVARECKKQGLKILAYFNTYYDDNPEFAAWRAIDQRGRPLVLSPGWPSALVSMHSPYRDRVLEQIRELLVNYDVDSLWFDVPKYPSISYDRWSREAFRKQYGKDMEEASPAERRKFALDSTAQWFVDIAAWARKIKPSVIIVPHGGFDPASVAGPNYTARMAGAADYFTVEMHTAAVQDGGASTLAGLAKPAEAGSLISDFWFTPIEGEPPKSSKSPSESLAEVATVFTSGVNLWLAFIMGHDGTADEATLALLDQAGAWLKSRRPYLEGATTLCDVGIVMGTADPEEQHWPGGIPPEGAAGRPPGDVWGALEGHLRSSGYPPCRLATSKGLHKWDAIPPGTRTLIVPDRVSLSAEDAARVRGFAARGGSVLAFGRGVSLGVTGRDVGKADEIFGIRSAGYVLPNPWADGTRLELAKGKYVPLWTLLIHVRPTSAETLLWAENRIEGGMPGLTRNRVGAGRAYFFATADSALDGKPEVLQYLWKETIGEPLWRVRDVTPLYQSDTILPSGVLSQEAPSGSTRYRARLRLQGNRRIVHIIDSRPGIGGPLPRNRSRHITLEINAKHFPFRSATLAPRGTPLKVTPKEGWNALTLYPDPEVTLVLEP
ncbi:MAG: alpha-L-fucosidase [Bryobacteraceae bacterium]